MENDTKNKILTIAMKLCGRIPLRNLHDQDCLFLFENLLRIMLS